MQSLICGIAHTLFNSASQSIQLSQISPLISSGKDKVGRGRVPLYGSTGIIGFASKASHNEALVLVARVGTIGKIQYVDTPCCVSDNTLIINAGEWNRYIYYYLSIFDFGRITSGTTQPLITARSLRKVEIPFFELSKRKEIVKTLFVMEQKIKAEYAIQAQYGRYKDYFLRQMFI